MLNCLLCIICRNAAIPTSHGGGGGGGGVFPGVSISLVVATPARPWPTTPPTGPWPPTTRRRTKIPTTSAATKRHRPSTATCTTASGQWASALRESLSGSVSSLCLPVIVFTRCRCWSRTKHLLDSHSTIFFHFDSYFDIYVLSFITMKYALSYIPGTW